MTKKVLTYSQFYRKYFGKNTAAEILFGWFDYCHKHKIDAYAKPVALKEGKNEPTKDSREDLKK